MSHRQDGFGTTRIRSNECRDGVNTFHGRNVHGWLDKGENWRAVRCLYRYNNKELEEWVERLEQLKRRQRTYTYYLTIIQAEMRLIMRNSL